MKCQYGRNQKMDKDCQRKPTHTYINHATDPDTIKMKVCREHAEELDTTKQHIEIKPIEHQANRMY